MRSIAILLCLLVSEGIAMSQTSSADGPHNTSVGIEKLHQADIAATVARDPDGLTALWDDDALLLQPGQSPLIGKAQFREFVKQNFAKSPSAKVLKYFPDIRDVQVVGAVAYEWGYFDSTFQPSEKDKPVTFRARFMRVLKQQPDGNWKFTRVMWAAE